MHVPRPRMHQSNQRDEVIGGRFAKLT